MGRIAGYAGGVSLIAAGLMVGLWDAVMLGIRGLDGWPGGAVGFVFLYAALADATIVLGVLMIRRSHSSA